MPMNKDLRDYGEEINKFHRRQKWGGVQHVDVVEGERENNWWQGERGRREWEGLYDGCDNWIGRMTKLVSILATLSEEKGFSNFCYLFILYCSSCKKLVSTYYPSFLFHFLGLPLCNRGLYLWYSSNWVSTLVLPSLFWFLTTLVYSSKRLYCKTSFEQSLMALID